MKNLRGKRVLVYGMGGSGNSACRLLHKLGACVSVFDDDKNIVRSFVLMNSRFVINMTL